MRLSASTLDGHFASGAASETGAPGASSPADHLAAQPLASSTDRPGRLPDQPSIPSGWSNPLWGPEKGGCCPIFCGVLPFPRPLFGRFPSVPCSRSYAQYSPLLYLGHGFSPGTLAGELLTLQLSPPWDTVPPKVLNPSAHHRRRPDPPPAASSIITISALILLLRPLRCSVGVGVSGSSGTPPIYPRSPRGGQVPIGAPKREDAAQILAASSRAADPKSAVAPAAPVHLLGCSSFRPGFCLWFGDPASSGFRRRKF